MAGFVDVARMNPDSDSGQAAIAELIEHGMNVGTRGYALEGLARAVRDPLPRLHLYGLRAEECVQILDSLAPDDRDPFLDAFARRFEKPIERELPFAGGHGLRIYPDAVTIARDNEGRHFVVYVSEGCIRVIGLPPGASGNDREIAIDNGDGLLDGVVLLPELVPGRTVLGVIERCDRKVRSSKIHFLEIMGTPVRVSRLSDPVEVAGEVSARAVRIARLGDEDRRVLVIGTRTSSRALNLFDLTSFPGAPERIETEGMDLLLLNEDGKCSDIRQIAIAPGKDGGSDTLILGLGAYTSPGVQVLEFRTDPETDGIEPTHATLELASESSAIAGYFPFGCVDGVGLVDIRGIGEHVLVVSKGYTNKHRRLGAEFVIGVPDGLYAYAWGGARVLDPLGGDGVRAPYAISREKQCGTDVRNLEFANLDGKPGEEILVTQCVTVEGEESRAAHLLARFVRPAGARATGGERQRAKRDRDRSAGNGSGRGRPE